MPIPCFFLRIRRRSTDIPSAVMSRVHAATCGMCHTAGCCFLEFNSAASLLVCSLCLFFLGLSSNELCCDHHRYMSIFAKNETHQDHIDDSSISTHQIHIYDPTIPTMQAPYLWSMHTKQQSSMSMIHEYLVTKIHIYDPCIPTHQDTYQWSAIPINRALYRWPTHTCQPAPYLSMIHAYQPTKIHIYDASIPANEAPYLWSMHTYPPSPYLWSMHTNQPSSISMVHSYLQTSSISIYDPCIPTNQDPYLRFIHICRSISMIHAYQPTKIHIYDPSIPANQAPYLWAMHTYPPSP